MSLLKIESFAGFTSPLFVTQYPEGRGGAFSSSFSRPPFTHGWRVSGNGTSIIPFSASEWCYFGAAVRCVVTTTLTAIRLYGTSTQHVTLDLNPINNVIGLNVGGTVVLTNYSVPTLAMNTWNYIEMGIRVNASAATGSFELRFNGQTIYSESRDTYGAGSVNVSRIGFVDSTTTGQVLDVSDMYVTDLNGGPDEPKGFLGDCRVIPSYPNANGDTINFLPLSASNFQMVDDIVYDSAATFVSASETGSEDLYKTNTSSSATTPIVYGMSVKALAIRSQPFTKQIVLALKSGSTTHYSTTQSLIDTYRIYEHTYNLNPNTSGSWQSGSLSDALNSQIGFRIVG